MNPDMEDRLEYLQQQLWELQNRFDQFQSAVEKTLNLKVDEILALLKRGGSDEEIPQ